MAVAASVINFKFEMVYSSTRYAKVECLLGAPMLWL
jgi:hypothetical protein